MKEIRLTQGKVALVDDEDFEELNQHKWYALKSCNTFYAQRAGGRVNGSMTTIKMHHVILGKPPKGFVTDHRSGCGVDNQRHNLRFVTHRQNIQNIKKGNSSKYSGVCWVKRNKKWHAQITVNKIKKHLGYFKSELQAFLAYQQAVESLGQTVIDTPKQGIPNNQNFHS